MHRYPGLVRGPQQSGYWFGLASVVTGVEVEANAVLVCF